MISASTRKRIATTFAERILEESLTLRLFDNDPPLSEMSGGGYAAHTLARRDWTVSVGDQASAVSEVVEFKFDGTSELTALGWYLSRPSGEILQAEEFASPIRIRRAGDIVPVRVTLVFGRL